MRIRSSRESSRFEPESIRLPLIALIDVVLFLLFYFVLSYSVSADERELSAGVTTIGGSGSDFQPQILDVVWVDGHPAYRIANRTMTERTQLALFLAALPHEPGLIVRSAPEVPVEALAGAVQEARNAGFAGVTYAPWSTTKSLGPAPAGAANP